MARAGKGTCMAQMEEVSDADEGCDKRYGGRRVCSLNCVIP
jgi:hypothetical protein